MAIKICAKCGKKFSTKSDNIVLCQSCMNADVVREAKRLNAVYATKKCPACGEEFTITVGEKEFYEAHSMALPRFCKPCRDMLKEHRAEMQEEHTCAKCGGTFHMSALNILMNLSEGRELPADCPACRQAEREEARKQDARRKPYKTVTCKDCGKSFVITQGEHDFLTEHGYENDPVRCYDCRKKRKATTLAQDMRDDAAAEQAPEQEETNAPESAPASEDMATAEAAARE